jgi:hypothetical protein
MAARALGEPGRDRGPRAQRAQQQRGREARRRGPCRPPAFGARRERQRQPHRAGGDRGEPRAARQRHQQRRRDHHCSRHETGRIAIARGVPHQKHRQYCGQHRAEQDGIPERPGRTHRDRALRRVRVHALPVDRVQARELELRVHRGHDRAHEHGRERPAHIAFIAVRMRRGERETAERERREQAFPLAQLAPQGQVR